MIIENRFALPAPPAERRLVLTDKVLAGQAARYGGGATIVPGFPGKPGRVDPGSLSDLAGYTLATAMSRSPHR